MYLLLTSARIFAINMQQKMKPMGELALWTVPYAEKLWNKVFYRECKGLHG